MNKELLISLIDAMCTGDNSKAFDDIVNNTEHDRTFGDMYDVIDAVRRYGSRKGKVVAVRTAEHIIDDIKHHWIPKPEQAG